MFAKIVVASLCFNIDSANLYFRGNRPHIVPITLRQSRFTLERWINQTSSLAFEDVSDDGMLRETLVLGHKAFWFNTSSPENIASFALVHENDIRAVALLENINENIFLWNLSVKPGEFQFGSDLIRLLHRTLGKKFTIGNTRTNRRWKIARSYFMNL